jgi:S-adenosylmethionine synthetase
MNTKISEWVSVGHPDRTADYIASRIITEIYKKDGKNAHAAIEIALFDNKVIIGGEVRTTLPMTPEYWTPIVREAIDRIGYNKEYRNKFSKDDCYISEDYEVQVYVNQQSPDIAKGTTDKADTEPGWNDQGTYVGYCSTEFDTHGLSIPHYIATSFGNYLYNHALNDSTLGIDIKTLVIYKEYKNIQKVSNITVAIPFIKDSPSELVMNLFEGWMLTQPQSINQLFSDGVNFLVNGTGIYKRHGSLGDSGVTGRKLVVNQCGNYAAGGSMIKPILASDRLLNLYARHISKVICDSGLSKEVMVELSASIGQAYLESIKITCIDKTRDFCDKLEQYFLSIPVSPNILNNKWKTLERNNYDEAVFNNFFGSTDYTIEPWEEVTNEEKADLLEFISKA